MSTDHTAAALAAALREFGESLGRALSEGITRGLQDGLSRSLDLETLAERIPARAAEGVATGLQTGGRRGGRPRGESRPCKVAGCGDPARSRGLCSRHYQQELRREKAGGVDHVGPSEAEPPVAARPPIVRKRPEHVEVPAVPVAVAAPAPANEASFVELRRESPLDAAKRVFG